MPQPFQVSADIIQRAADLRKMMLDHSISDTEKQRSVHDALTGCPALLDGFVAMPLDIVNLNIQLKGLLLDGLMESNRLDLLHPLFDKMTESVDDFFYIINPGFLINEKARRALLSYLPNDVYPEKTAVKIFSYSIHGLLDSAVLSSNIQPYTSALFDIVEHSPCVDVTFLKLLNYYINTNASVLPHMQQIRAQGMLKTMLEAGFDQEEAFETSTMLQQPNGQLADQVLKYRSFLHFALCQPSNALVEVLLEEGANWRRLLEDPAVSDEHRENLLRQPYVRKALLEDVRNQASTTGSQATPQPMKI